LGWFGFNEPLTLGRARILDTGRQTIGHAKALLKLAQQQNPAIR
jgi:hypothetical protein